ncbi:MAG TPA: inositol monophosphatase [Ornithinimicrobium sp.]|uniref:inositol monophosphatase family protein n=1 Tax=Ornithinimicrobium sp. TaxID=1977084 RepID=UPI002B48EC7D|nr:inositol monophosphatase [Ornithinimicrobium sp.]HKJ13059.1 inositol monophosphatase [Ornithinimicrobium sp.]
MDTEDVLCLLQEVADTLVTPRFRALEEAQVQEKAPGDLVTVADREAEAVITARLRAAYPEAVILGEEASALDPGVARAYASADHAFTIDPVDGTKNFVHGSPDHAVMVAELRGGQCVRSWIHQPQHQRSCVAERGAGAFNNGRRMVRPPVSADPSRVRAVSARRDWLGRMLGDIGPIELTWVCCGVDYPHLIDGHADVALYSGTNPWDHAPGTLLTTEAGGHVGTFDGSPYDPRRAEAGLVVAGDRATYERVLAELGALPRR